MNSEKLLKCMMTDAPKPLTDEQIATAEKKLNRRFPAEFKRFFAKWNGAEFEGFDGSFCLALECRGSHTYRIAQLIGIRYFSLY